MLMLIIESGVQTFLIVFHEEIFETHYFLGLPCEVKLKFKSSWNCFIIFSIPAIPPYLMFATYRHNINSILLIAGVKDQATELR
jgi:hypothetical protein